MQSMSSVLKSIYMPMSVQFKPPSSWLERVAAGVVDGKCMLNVLTTAHEIFACELTPDEYSELLLKMISFSLRDTPIEEHISSLLEKHNAKDMTEQFNTFYALYEIEKTLGIDKLEEE